MKIDDRQLLYDLFDAYYAAREHKRNTRSQLDFELRLEENMIRLYDELRSRRYSPSPCICFVTTEPVTREVFASQFRDRVVHHLLFNYISPILERTFIYDSYSCRKEKGTLKALERYEHHIRSCSDNYTRDCYILQLDLKGYFMSITKQILYGLLCDSLGRMRNRKAENGKRWDDVVDFEFVDYLIREILMRNPTDHVTKVGRKRDWENVPPSKSLFCQPEGVGLPIGDLTSQLFSNVYLNPLDQFCKRDLACRHYGRYVDDFYIIDNSKTRLKTLVPVIRDMLKSRLGVMLHPHKVHITHCWKGTQFMGGYVLPHRRMLRARTIWKFHRAMEELFVRFSSSDEMSRTEIAASLASINSYCGLLGHYDSYNLRKRTLFRPEMYRYLNFMPKFSKCVIKKDKEIKKWKEVDIEILRKRFADVIDRL